MSVAELVEPSLLVLGLVAAVLVPPAVRATRASREAAILAEAALRREMRAADEYAAVATADLARRARSAADELTDALAAAGQDLPRTRVHLGARRAQELDVVLSDAGSAHADVLRLRDLLDGIRSDDERAVRDAATQILRTCRGPVARLDAQLAVIDSARTLEGEVDAALGALADDAARHRSRAGALRATLTALAASYPPEALTGVVRDLDRATAALAGVEATITQGRRRAVAGAAPGAVGSARAAQESLAQVACMLDAVAAVPGELAAAGPRLDAGIASLTADLADVERLGPRGPHVAELVREAEVAVAAAVAARSGTGDPRAALHQLATAEAALDAALDPARDAQVRGRLAAPLLGDTLARLDVALQATRYDVEAGAGSVRSGARTRLAKAAHLHSRAHAQRATDPGQALTDAQQAVALLEAAQALVRRDVRRAVETGLEAWRSPVVRDVRPGWHSGRTGWGDDASAEADAAVDPPSGGESLLGRLTGWDDSDDAERRDPWYG